jgi:hypothetical protein
VHGTRLIGLALLGYAMLFPEDPDRGTFIMGGLGMLGTELVAGREAKK